MAELREHAEAVVVAVAEAAGDAAVEFDEAVHGFCAAVVRAVGVEVAEELATPRGQGLAEALDLGERAGHEGGQDLLGDGSSGGVAGLVVGVADLLSAPPSDFDLDASFVRGPRRFEA